MICKNCNTEVTLNYCPNCGQPAKLHRIDGHYIQHEMEHILHFERGILFTIRELLLRPGQSIREFIADNRARLVKPIIFIIVTSLIYTLTIHYFHVEDGYVKLNAPEAVFTSKMFKWYQDHYGYGNIMMAVFIAFWIKVFFKKYEYNFFEILILLCFIIGIAMLIYALFALIVGLTKLPLMFIGGILGFIYISWAIGQFFDKTKLINYGKAFLAYILGMITFTILAFLIGFSVDAIMKL
ncbi:hypothetical protein GCM10011514_13780 [Emticicia aquatilis]|uniref:DUF3667 domain-containing protein n=1 Tax=Emticicia aquatilis TaxID=1537369 RepID=A0A917DLU1_9BACT|nr:DUF3667 domain-containing protein [Emticicia aquatilis]GGD50764.1 hypothetical protein GCM10011514_13780 [Emticicia aquatilis]